MRALYDSLIAEGEAGILKLIAQRTQEGLQLDFKQKVRPSHGAFEDNDRKILAKSVSGFANSAGGLIVWGVNAEKVDGVDCARPPAAPISYVEQFASEAATLVGQLIQPKHDGIHIAPIPCTSGDGSGFLLIYVERSERRPHRSEAKGQKQYFKRAGDSFFEMEHYDIEDAFSRTAVPELDLSVSEGGWSSVGADRSQIVQIRLKNISSHLASYPYIVLDTFENLAPEYRHLNPSGMRETIERARVVLAGGSDHVIHPGLDFIAAGLILHAIRVGSSWEVNGQSADKSTVSFGYTIGCAGGRARFGRFVMQASVFLP